MHDLLDFQRSHHILFAFVLNLPSQVVLSHSQSTSAAGATSTACGPAVPKMEDIPVQDIIVLSALVLLLVVEEYSGNTLRTGWKLQIQLPRDDPGVMYQSRSSECQI